ncbi:hypothetical protein DQ04_18511000 [Trypanosoma grayi]|uniref:hypothetical protein n=1 Tax=Trypanosoma grayi TaxID=71804 RepID=UPI0004F416EA|nr:hypothetical protein DQ04_18511000 [Trypanosoma grayi]KEG05779.1 hypothetical protein DQ04_18511000 [Trypanosoma grayi]
MTTPLANTGDRQWKVHYPSGIGMSNSCKRHGKHSLHNHKGEGITETQMSPTSPHKRLELFWLPVSKLSHSSLVQRGGDEPEHGCCHVDESFSGPAEWLEGIAAEIQCHPRIHQQNKKRWLVHTSLKRLNHIPSGGVITRQSGASRTSGTSQHIALGDPRCTVRSSKKAAELLLLPTRIEDNTKKA